MDVLWNWFARLLVSDAVVVTVLVVPIFLLLEHFRPVRRATLGHYLFGIGYWLCNLVLVTLVAPWLITWVAIGSQAVGLGLIDLRFLGLGGFWGAAVAVLVSTIISDFFSYWFHRTQHTNSVLWQTHLLHHSDEHMNVMTGHRSHVLEAIMLPFFVGLPMAVLFDLPPVQIGVLSVLPMVYQFFVHANLDIGFGRFWWLLSSPNYHRIHHSIEQRHWNRNFANYFPLWDIIFGTAYNPAKGELPETGVDGVLVKTIPQALLLPFTGWWRMLRDRRLRPAPRDG